MVNLTGPSYDLDSRPASVQRTVNMMPVPIEPGNERAGWFLRDVPGLDAFGSPLVACIRPVFTITADPESGDAPLAVSFSVEITDGEGPFTYLWDFGDGSASTAEAPEHVYVDSGTYTVSVIVSNACGDSETTTIEVESVAPEYLFLDNFDGEASTDIEEHTPDIAPEGFAWALTLRELVLDGLGGLTTPNLGGSSGDASADSSASDPAFTLTLTRPYSIEITAQAYDDEEGEPVSFRIANGSTWCQVEITNPIEGGGVRARFSTSASGLVAHYPVDAITEHTMKAKFNEDGTATFYVDGVEEGSASYTPISSADSVQVYVARGVGVGVAKRVCIIQEVA